MITIHHANTTTVTGTGLGVLDNQIINPEVAEELNASFTLSFDYPAWGEHANQLVLGNIVACPVPWTDTKQAFRITAIDTSLGQVLRVEAVHVFFDLAHNLIADTYVVNQTPSAALTQLLGAANYPHSFTATSADTGTVASARIVRTSIAAALLDTDTDNSFLSRCGGEFVFDNWHIHHAPRRGSLTGIVIQDRKNLTGYQSSIDTAALATRILPVGYDGLLLPELYVDSPRIDDYPFAHVRVFKYEAVKAIKDPAKPGEDELPLEQAYERLRELATAEFTSGVDVPTSSYEVSFVDLSQTVEYAEFAELEQVDLGDTVTVKHTDLGVNLQARVTAYTYNPLTRSYNQIMLGSVRPSFTMVAKTIQGFSEAVNQAQEVAATALASADGKNTNYYSPAKPAHPRLGDTWFKNEGESGVSIWTYAITDSGEPSWIPLTGAINMALLNQTLADTETEVETIHHAVAEIETATELIDQKVSDTHDEIHAARAVADNARETALQASSQADSVAVNLGSLSSEISSSLTMLSNNINLRVAKGEIISQINLSPESILIDGSKVHITGQTSIDNAIITTAMIRDAAITDAKIGSLSAAKITTGTLSAARIGAGSITSDKLTIANGFIKTAMIADAAITNAKISAIDAGKITTGYLAAARIKAGSITADKFASNAIQVGLAGWTSTIRITPTQIGWYNQSTLQGTITAEGMKFWYGTRFIGVIGENYKTSNTSVRGIVMNLNGQGD